MLDQGQELHFSKTKINMNLVKWMSSNKSQLVAIFLFACILGELLIVGVKSCGDGKGGKGGGKGGWGKGKPMKMKPVKPMKKKWKAKSYGPMVGSGYYGGYHHPYNYYEPTVQSHYPPPSHYGAYPHQVGAGPAPYYDPGFHQGYPSHHQGYSRAYPYGGQRPSFRRQLGKMLIDSVNHK